MIEKFVDGLYNIRYGARIRYGSKGEPIYCYLKNFNGHKRYWCSNSFCGGYYKRVFNKEVWHSLAELDDPVSQIFILPEQFFIR